MKKNRISLFFLTAMLVFSLTLFVVLAEASGTTYPFKTGDGSFDNGVKWTGPTVTKDYWQFLQVGFDMDTAADLSSVDYLAIQIHMEAGNPGFTYGLLQGGDRFATAGVPDNTKEIYFMDEDGTISSLGNVQFGAVWVGEGAKGALIIPMDSLGWQWNNENSDLTKVRAFYMTTNSLFNRDWVVSIGEIGYYVGDPRTGGSYTKLRNLEVVPSTRHYYYDSSVDTKLDYIGYVPEKKIFTNEYPFRTGDSAFVNGKVWQFPQTGIEVDDFQRLSINFDQDTVNFTDATYLAIQLTNLEGAPGLTYGLKSGSDIYSMAGVQDGNPVYQLKENKQVLKVTEVLYSSATTSLIEGAVLIPMNAMGWNNVGSNDLSSVSSLIIETNRKYNYNFKVRVGEIGYFTGELGNGEEYHKILDLSDNKDGKFFVSGSVTNETSLITVGQIVERTEYGDTTINFTATGKVPANFPIWQGGSLGLVEMVEDSYGDTAIRLKATGSNPLGDAYTAFDILSTANFSWADQEGITFWARNDSNREISFNIEVDNKIVSSGISDRFNITQGERFYLYDINTGKTSIYMTKPTATLPVGFEGWVRIPFTAFRRAAWSNNGVTTDLFMKQGTDVTYLAVTLHSSVYQNLPFSLNKFGSYSSDASFISVFVGPTLERKTIAELMDLNG